MNKNSSKTKTTMQNKHCSLSYSLLKGSFIYWLWYIFSNTEVQFLKRIFFHSDKTIKLTRYMEVSTHRLSQCSTRDHTSQSKGDWPANITHGRPREVRPRNTLMSRLVMGVTAADSPRPLHAHVIQRTPCWKQHISTIGIINYSDPLLKSLDTRYWRSCSINARALRIIATMINFF